VYSINLIFLLRTVIRFFQYLLSPTRRYAYLLLLILRHRPKTILEIGVYTGKRSKDMILASRIFNNRVSYFGFDLFEDFYKEKEILRKEFSKKPLTKKIIYNNLRKLAKTQLFKGYTSKTLEKFSNKKIKVDFIFIDGGHSIETIRNDWFWVKKFLHKKSVVIFDDFYQTKNTNIINKFGCNLVIRRLTKDYYYKILSCFGIGGDLINILHKKIKVFFVMVRPNQRFLT